MNHDERNAGLVELCLAGDSQAADELIISNIGLVKATVDIVLRLWPSYRYLYSDLVGDGLLALTQVVRHLDAPPTASFKSLVIGAVRLALFKVFERQECPYTDTFCHVEINGEDPLLAVECQDLEKFEVLEYLLAKCLDDRERQILSLYLRRHTVEEIAAELGVTKLTIIRGFNRYRKRLQEAILQELA